MLKKIITIKQVEIIIIKIVYNFFKHNFCFRKSTFFSKMVQNKAKCQKMKICDVISFDHRMINFVPFLTLIPSKF